MKGYRRKGVEDVYDALFAEGERGVSRRGVDTRSGALDCRGAILAIPFGSLEASLSLARRTGYVSEIRHTAQPLSTPERPS